MILSEGAGGGERERDSIQEILCYIPFVCCQMYARERLVEVGAPFSQFEFRLV